MIRVYCRFVQPALIAIGLCAITAFALGYRDTADWPVWLVLVCPFVAAAFTPSWEQAA